MSDTLDAPGVRVGAVDCGTNSIRLLVADLRRDDSGQVRLTDVVREMRIIRLGEGVDRTGRISPEALERAREALSAYVDTMVELKVERVRMVATSAMRDATNRDDFFAMTAELLGRCVPGTLAEVIDGEVEAELTFAGAISDLDTSAGPVVVTDLGGGSTEIVVGSAERGGGHGGARILGAHSMNIGCVRLSERVLHSDPPTGEEIAAARAVISDALALALGESGAVPVEQACRWVGVAGTFTTLSALVQGLDEYDPQRIHGSVLAFDALRNCCQHLVESTVAERLALGPMHPGRADVIGGGSLVVQALCDVMADRAGLHELTISEKDILDGIALSLSG